jgi:hypothetical protein
VTDQPEQFGRPFRLHLPDGAIYHGVEFPSGRVAIDLEHSFRVAISVDGLLADAPEGAIVVRREEPQS